MQQPHGEPGARNHAMRAPLGVGAAEQCASPPALRLACGLRGPAQTHQSSHLREAGAMRQPHGEPSVRRSQAGRAPQGVGAAEQCASPPALRLARRLCGAAQMHQSSHLREAGGTSSPAGAAHLAPPAARTALLRRGAAQARRRRRAGCGACGLRGAPARQRRPLQAVVRKPGVDKTRRDPGLPCLGHAIAPRSLRRGPAGSELRPALAPAEVSPAWCLTVTVLNERMK